jgi:cytochrome c556
MRKTIRGRTLAIATLLIGAVLTGPAMRAQAPTMKQIMLDFVHPASNDILLTVNRGGPADEKEWATVRRSALALAESGKLLTAPGGSSSDVWTRAAKMLSDAGTDAYKAAQLKDAKALAATTAHIDASCTTCHRQFRPNVFPPQGGSK